MLWNAHVPITPRWYRRELWGHVFGCSCACVCSGLPDCLRAAFVPALIWCQWGLAGSWHPDTSPSIRWHRVVGGIKNDPIRGWQCVLTGTTWWGVFKTAFWFSYRSVCTPPLPVLVLRAVFPAAFSLPCASRSGWQWWKCDYVCSPWHPLFVRFFQLFAINIPALCKCADTRGLVLTKNTVIRALSDRNIIHRVSLSLCIAVTDKSLDFPFSRLRLCFFPLFSIPFDILDPSVVSKCSWSSAGISASGGSFKTLTPKQENKCL